VPRTPFHHRHARGPRNDRRDAGPTRPRRTDLSKNGRVRQPAIRRADAGLIDAVAVRAAGACEPAAMSPLRGLRRLFALESARVDTQGRRLRGPRLGYTGRAPAPRHQYTTRSEGAVNGLLRDTVKVLQCRTERNLHGRNRVAPGLGVSWREIQERADRFVAKRKPPM